MVPAGHVVDLSLGSPPHQFISSRMFIRMGLEGQAMTARKDRRP